MQLHLIPTLALAPLRTAIIHPKARIVMTCMLSIILSSVLAINLLLMPSEALSVCTRSVKTCWRPPSFQQSFSASASSHLYYDGAYLISTCDSVHVCYGVSSSSKPQHSARTWPASQVILDMVSHLSVVSKHSVNSQPALKPLLATSIIFTA